MKFSFLCIIQSSVFYVWTWEFLLTNKIAHWNTILIEKKFTDEHQWITKKLKNYNLLNNSRKFVKQLDRRGFSKSVWIYRIYQSLFNCTIKLRSKTRTQNDKNAYTSTSNTSSDWLWRRGWNSIRLQQISLLCEFWNIL